VDIGMKKIGIKSVEILRKSTAQLILVALIIFFGIKCQGMFFTVNNGVSQEMG